MTTRAAAIIGACVLAGGLAIGVGFAQQPKPVTTGGSTNSTTRGSGTLVVGDMAPTGRYQVAGASAGPGLSAAYMVVIDTATGRCWYKPKTAPGWGDWMNIGSPLDRPQQRK